MSALPLPQDPFAQSTQVQPITVGDLSGATERFGREYGAKPDQSNAALEAYKTFRAQGQDHENAYQSAAKAQNWAQPSGSAAPTSPVTATGGIPPPVAPPQPGQQADARTPAPVAAAPTYTAQNFANTLTPTAISQFSAPDQSGINNQQTSLLNAILARPETLDANTVAQMKEAQKEQALLLGQQSASQFAQGAVGRGVLGGGRTDAFRANNDSNINNAILSGNRSVDLSAIAQNRQDQLNALTASSGIAQDQLGRASSSYQTGLQGQLAGDSSKLQHAQFGLGVDQANAGQQQLQYSSQKDANDAAYARALGIAQNAQSTYGQDLSAQLANKASDLDMQKFLAQKDQFAQQLGQQGSQFQDTLGYNYNQLDQTGNLTQQQILLNAIAGR